jgi:hypothetical protein
MKQILLVAGSAAFLSACTAMGPPTAWGKPGVSKVDYVADLGMCTGLAAMQEAGNGANTAGGINGRNASAPTGGGGDAAKAAGTGSGTTSAPSGAAIPTGGGGLYRESADPDIVQRAATQQRSQEMAAKKARSEALKSCYTERGYQEFKLTPEQRAHLGTLKPGSNEYLSYLAEIGSDPSMVKSPIPAKAGS